MEQFHQRDFAHRFGAMGDEAESRFEETYKGGFVRFGLNRPPVQMSKLPPLIRYSPDYLTSQGFVECQGVGKDRQLKVKVEKGLALQQWHSLFAVRFFIWDSMLKKSTILDWPTLWNQLPNMPLNQFPEGKAYWSVDVDTHVWT